MMQKTKMRAMLLAVHLTQEKKKTDERRKRKEFIGKYRRPTRIKYMSRGNGSGTRQHLHAQPSK